MSANPSESATAEPAADAPAHRRGGMQAALLVGGIMLIAITLRGPYTGVGPLLSAIRADMGLSASIAGLLTSIPLFAFGLVSPAAPRIAHRFGIEATLMGVVVLLSLGIAVRWLPSAVALFLGTAMLGAAIAVGNVMMPSIVKREFPGAIGLMTSVYVTLMALVGALGSGISVPIAEAAPGGWRTSLVIWLLPALIAAGAWSAQLGRGTTRPSGPGTTAGHVRLWRSPLAWKVTLFMGLQSLGFYVILAWLPTILQQRGFSADFAGWLLFAMQSLSASCGMTVPLFLRRGFDPRHLAAGSSVACVIGYLGLTVAPQFAVLWVIIIAPGTGISFVMALTFVALRAGGVREAVALSGMAQGVGYFLAACGPVIFGALHDLTGGWIAGMIALVAVTLVQILSGYVAGQNGQISSGA